MMRQRHDNNPMDHPFQHSSSQWQQNRNNYETGANGQGPGAGSSLLLDGFLGSSGIANGAPGGHDSELRRRALAGAVIASTCTAAVIGMHLGFHCTPRLLL